MSARGRRRELLDFLAWLPPKASAIGAVSRRPAHKIYVKFENVVDSSERIAAMLNGTDRIGIARVVSGP
jgi:hypothetical protein